MKCFLYLSIVVFSYKLYGSGLSVLYVNDTFARIEISSTPQLFDLSINEKSELEVRSNSGDSGASYRLHQYYTYTCHNVDKQVKYLARAASQGDVIAQYNYAIFLSDRDFVFSKYYDLDKAIYWMELAAKNGDTDAKNKLRELKVLKEQKKY
ncbi:Sel1 repeat [Salmonella enterica subsp. salamae]|nr:sel1 repeat family protein [Salmonella enterica]EKT7778811.1 sel1 repeat family protein [Salmonella enterica]VEA63275.1 Sel1 repeat [Salmonella enterica subsp. salamae]